MVLIEMTVLSVDDAMAHLNMSSDDNAAKVEAMIEAAEAAIAKRVGPLEPTTITSVVDSGGGTFTLPLIPVISLTSVAVAYSYGFPSGPFDSGTLTLDGGSGIVSSPSYGLPAGRYTVEYVAGRTECPPDLLLAVKEMVRHLWRSQRGAASLPGQGGSDTPAPGFLIPNAVAELLSPHRTYGFGLV